jgi:hypothetical protein
MNTGFFALGSSEHSMSKESVPKLAMTFIPYLTSIIAGNLVTLGGLSLQPLTAVLLMVVLLALYSFFYSQHVWQAQQVGLKQVAASQLELQNKVSDSLAQMMVWLGQPVELIQTQVQASNQTMFFAKLTELILDLRPGDEVMLQLMPATAQIPSMQLERHHEISLKSLLSAVEHQRIGYTLLITDGGLGQQSRWQHLHCQQLLELSRQLTQAHLVKANPMIHANMLVVWRANGQHSAILDVPIGDQESGDFNSHLGLIFRSPRHTEIIAKLRDVLHRTQIAGQPVKTLPDLEDSSILRLPRLAG